MTGVAASAVGRSSARRSRTRCLRVLHQAAYDALGLPDWTYRAVECDEAAARDTLRRLEAEGLAGVSLTMPLKRAVLPLLTRVERLAADVGAANTVMFGGVAGEWWGANTDVAWLRRRAAARRRRRAAQRRTCSAAAPRRRRRSRRCAELGASQVTSSWPAGRSARRSASRSAGRVRRGGRASRPGTCAGAVLAPIWSCSTMPAGARMRSPTCCRAGPACSSTWSTRRGPRRLAAAWARAGGRSSAAWRCWSSRRRSRSG